MLCAGSDRICGDRGDMAGVYPLVNGDRGGICFIIFSLVAERLREKNIFIKAAVCALGVTVVEFLFGVLFNIILGMRVWDYSHMPLNILGQVCPLFTLLWGGIAIAFLPLAEVINQDYA